MYVCFDITPSGGWCFERILGQRAQVLGAVGKSSINLTGWSTGALRLGDVEITIANYGCVLRLAHKLWNRVLHHVSNWADMYPLHFQDLRSPLVWRLRFVLDQKATQPRLNSRWLPHHLLLLASFAPLMPFAKSGRYWARMESRERGKHCIDLRKLLGAFMFSVVQQLTISSS